MENAYVSETTDFVKEAKNEYFEMNIIKANSTPEYTTRFKLKKLVESCGYITDDYDYPTAIYRHVLSRHLFSFYRALAKPVGKYELKYDFKTIDMSGESGELINIAEKFENHGFKVNLELK